MKNPFLTNLSRLTQFGGRESRKHFWLHVAISLIFYAAPFFILMIVTMITGLMATTDAQAPSMDIVAYGSIILALVQIALLAAAVSRRLHDSDRRAGWGLIPVPFLLFGIFMFPLVIGSAISDSELNNRLFFAGFINNIIYMILIILLGILLCQSGDDGENRFGPPPLT
ncbi:MAG: DUF805 domain-containing protein [Hyphomonas sp.]